MKRKINAICAITDEKRLRIAAQNIVNIYTEITILFRSAICKFGLVCGDRGLGGNFRF